MVVSSACINVATITQAVIAARLPPPGVSVEVMTGPLEERGQEVGEPARMLSVDGHLRAHAGTQRRHARIAGIDEYAYLHPLHDLDPVAARVLRRQKREFLRGRRTHALHGSVPADSGVSVDAYAGLLTGPHVGELSLLRRGVDPDVMSIHEVERGGRGRQKLARSNGRHVGHYAGKGRHHDGVKELALRFGNL